MPKILIIEDNPKTARGIADHLSDQKLEFSFASNGIEGIEKLRQEKIDLVVLDLQMPKMSGDHS